MSMPTAEEAICLYLYGQKTPPGDLKTEQLIREPGSGNNPLYVKLDTDCVAGMLGSKYEIQEIQSSFTD